MAHALRLDVVAEGEVALKHSVRAINHDAVESEIPEGSARPKFVDVHNQVRNDQTEHSQSRHQQDEGSAPEILIVSKKNGRKLVNVVSSCWFIIALSPSLVRSHSPCLSG